MASNGRADNRMTKGGWERQTKPMGPATGAQPIGPRTTPRPAPKSAGDLALRLLGGKSPRRI